MQFNNEMRPDSAGCKIPSSSDGPRIAVDVQDSPQHGVRLTPGSSDIRVECGISLVSIASGYIPMHALPVKHFFAKDWSVQNN